MKEAKPYILEICPRSTLVKEKIATKNIKEKRKSIGKIAGIPLIG
jgi:hypothetical protein